MNDSKFDSMMARITPVSLHFSDVPTGWKKKLYRQTTVGYWFCMFVTNSLSRRTYWFCMFVTNSLSRRTVLQINLRQLHSVPLGTQAFQLPQAASKHAADVACLPLLLLQQSGYCGRSLSGHLHGHDLSSSISVNTERSSSQSAGCPYSRFTTQSLQCPQM